jgi:glutathione S-transferase
MKLYYLKGACSLATYICLLEAGQKFEAYEVDRATRKTADGNDFNSINPKGYVPALVLDNGEVLTENVAVLSYVANLDKPGTFEQFRFLEWLTFITTEVHKNFGPMFRPGATEEFKAVFKENLARRFAYIEERLGDKPFLTGGNFTPADAYLYVTLSWRERLGVDISAFPKLTAFYERVRARPSVQQARKDEGLPP